MYKFLRYCVALAVILTVLVVAAHHANMDGLMRRIHGG